MPKPPSTKLASGTTARAAKEWIGKSPDDWPPPPRVQLRILERQKGKCAITGHKFRPGDKKRLDHLIPLADGGVNRERNLQWLFEAQHKDKTTAEAKVRKAVRKRAKTHAGIKTAPTQPLRSRNDLAQKAPPKVAKLPLPTGPNQLMRRYGIVDNKPKGKWMDKFPTPKQREALLPFLAALQARDKALRRDENGDWRISGTTGHIYAVPEGFQIMVTGRESVRYWNNAKKALAFAKVTQDGEDEGGLILDRHPTPSEAESIRHYCGLAKKREMTEEARAHLASVGKPFLPKITASDGQAGQ